MVRRDAVKYIIPFVRRGEGEVEPFLDSIRGRGIRSASFPLSFRAIHQYGHPERSACPEQSEGTICFSRRVVVEREILHFVQNDRFGMLSAIFISMPESGRGNGNTSRSFLWHFDFDGNGVNLHHFGGGRFGGERLNSVCFIRGSDHERIFS